MFREKIKVLDCTIRDGGLINEHQFEDKFVRAVYRAASLSGVDYVELGYQLSKTGQPLPVASFLVYKQLTRKGAICKDL